MLLYQCELPIKRSITKQMFLKSVLEWAKKDFGNDELKWSEWEKTLDFSYGDDKTIFIDAKEYKGITAFRYEKIKDKITRNSEITFIQGSMDIRYTETVENYDKQFYVPDLIAHLIDSKIISDDNGIEISRYPIMVNNLSFQTISDIVKGKKNFDMPVVYVSKDSDNMDPVNVMELAEALKGAAHVYSLSGVWMHKDLSEVCGGKIESDGNIGIYYPGGRHDTLEREKLGEYDDKLYKKVTNEISFYNHAHDIDMTWGNTVAMATLKRIEALEDARRAHSVSVSPKMLDMTKETIRKQAYEEGKKAAQKEIDSLKKKCEGQGKAIDRLTAENNGLKNKVAKTDTMPILVEGKEKDFYPGEIKDLVLASLSDYLSSNPKHTRRSDVIADIIDANDYKAVGKEKGEALKKALNGYKDMSASVKQELSSAGIVLSDEGKHYKGTYYGDPRYLIVYSRTPSDVKAGNNSALETIQKCF